MCPLPAPPSPTPALEASRLPVATVTGAPIGSSSSPRPWKTLSGLRLEGVPLIAYPTNQTISQHAGALAHALTGGAGEQHRGDLAGERGDALLQAGRVVVEVPHETLAPRPQGVLELPAHPRGGPGDNVPPPVVGPLPIEPVLDGDGQPQHHPALG